MGKLQDAFDRQIDNLPRLAIERVVRDKLRAEGIDDPTVLGRVVDAIIKGTEESVAIPFDRSLHLALTDEDLFRMGKAAEAFGERVPDIVDNLVRDVSKDLVGQLHEKWRQSVPDDDAGLATRARILKDWAAPLDSFRMLLTLCAEEGDNFNIAHLRSARPREDGRTQALARLHIRACRIAREILLLLENGFTEGAQARWRTLHEVTVTAALIAEGGDSLAERYFDHEIVDRKKALDDHRRAVAAGGEPPVARRHTTALEEEFAAAVAKYGKQFRGMYGWASDQLGMPVDPKFHDLQEVAGSLTLKLRYRLSSFDTHASPKALEQPVHRWDPTTHVPGAFEAGFEGPAVDTAHAIIQITALLYPQPWDLDAVVFVMALNRLREEVSDAWLNTARDIDKRERRSIERAARGPLRRLGYVKAKPGKRRV